MTSLEARLEALEEQAALLVDAVDLDTVWIIWCGILVFCEYCCYCCFYAVGSVWPPRPKAKVKTLEIISYPSPTINSSY